MTWSWKGEANQAKEWRREVVEAQEIHKLRVLESKEIHLETRTTQLA